MERLRLKISPKGQITIPKRLREKMFSGDYVYLTLEDQRAVLEPVSLAEEFDDLIMRDLRREGYTASEAAERFAGKKEAFLRDLDRELQERTAESDRDWEEGKAVQLWPKNTR